MRAPIPPSGFPVATRSLSLLAAAVLAAGCDAAPAPGDGPTVRDSAGIRLVQTTPAPAWGPDDGWYVERVLSSEASGAELGFVSDATLGPDGRVYALDMLAQAVTVLDPGGTPVATLAGPGEGPGELGKGVRSLVLVPGEDGPELWIPDPSGLGVERFDTAGAALGSLPLASAKGIPDVWRRGADGALYARSVEHTQAGDGSWKRKDLLSRVSPETGAEGRSRVVLDSVAAFTYAMDDLQKAPGTGLPPVVNAPTWTVLDDGTVAWTAIRDTDVRLLAPDGTQARLRRESWRPREPSEGEERALQLLAVESLRMQGAPLGPDADIPFEPMTWLPVLTDLRAGPEGTLWVQALGSARDVHPMNLNTGAEPFGWGGPTWEVFDAEGRYLGPVELPARFRVTEFRGDRIVGVRYDELFVDHVEVLEIVRPDPAP